MDFVKGLVVGTIIGVTGTLAAELLMEKDEANTCDVSDEVNTEKTDEETSSEN